MLMPTKHEKLELNTMVLGADIIAILKKGYYNIELLYQELKKIKDISLEQYYDSLLFLYLGEVIELDKYKIELKRSK